MKEAALSLALPAHSSTPPPLAHAFAGSQRTARARACRMLASLDAPYALNLRGLTNCREWMGRGEGFWASRAGRGAGGSEPLGRAPPPAPPQPLYLLAPIVGAGSPVQVTQIHGGRAPKFVRHGCNAHDPGGGRGACFQLGQQGAGEQEVAMVVCAHLGGRGSGCFQGSSSVRGGARLACRARRAARCGPTSPPPPLHPHPTPACDSKPSLVSVKGQAMMPAGAGAGFERQLCVGRGVRRRVRRPTPAPGPHRPYALHPATQLLACVVQQGVNSRLVGRHALGKRGDRRQVGQVQW